MNRIKASFIHFAISVSIFTLFAYLVYFVWYSYPFNLLEGVNQIVAIMAFVDVVLGPVLTFVLFKIGKPGLKLDLFLIASIQIFALVYGSYIIYSERPVFAVFHKGAFEVVDKSNIDFDKLPEGIKKVGFFDRPEFVYQQPLQGSAYKQLLKSLESERSVRYATHFESYLNYSENSDLVLKGTKEAKGVKEFKRILNVENYHYTYLDGSIHSVVVLLDKDTAEVKKYIKKTDLP